jgi:hypothetical protein
VSTLLALIQYSTGIPRQNNKGRERNKREGIKLFRLTDDMTLYLKDLKSSSKHFYI